MVILTWQADTSLIATIWNNFNVCYSFTVAFTVMTPVLGFCVMLSWVKDKPESTSEPSELLITA